MDQLFAPDTSHSTTHSNTKAVELHNQGRELGGEGRYQEALEVLIKSSQLAPDWPFPVYDMAYTYLLMQDNIRALEYYKKTDKLAPKGFFTTKTSIYYIEQELDGKYPPGLYLALTSLEHADERQQQTVLTQILNKFPHHAFAWKCLSLITDNPQEKMAMIEKGLECQPDLETYGILVINKALMLTANDKKEEGEKLLKDLLDNPNVTTSVQSLANVTLKHFNK